MTQPTTLEIQLQQGVAVVWLNRPELRNAFNDTMIAELSEVLEEIDADSEVRAMVLAARGPAFCAGADLQWMRRIAGYSRDQNRGDALRLAEMLHRLATLRKPTIARVHGAAYAGGMGLVAACDIAVASTEAQFCLSEVKLGLIPATISPHVLAAMGERMARRYFLTAERFDAAEAYRIGFVQELSAPEELDGTINAMLGHLVAAGPESLARTKDLIRSVARRPLDADLLADTADRIADTRASPEGREGVASYLEKRKPAWVTARSEGQVETGGTAAGDGA
jgi:methylglutaconyl-CoA hydratase